MRNRVGFEENNAAVSNRTDLDVAARATAVAPARTLDPPLVYTMPIARERRRIAW